VHALKEVGTYATTDPHQKKQFLSLHMKIYYYSLLCLYSIQKIIFPLPKRSEANLVYTKRYATTCVTCLWYYHLSLTQHHRMQMVTELKPIGCSDSSSLFSLDRSVFEERIFGHVRSRSIYLSASDFKTYLGE